MIHIRDILKRPRAAKVLNDDGSIRTSGEHVAKNPVYWVRDAHGRPVKKNHYDPFPVAGAAIAPQPLFISPPLPADGMPPLDLSGRPFWTETRPRAGGRQGMRSDCYRIAVIQAIALQAEWFLPFILHRSAKGINAVYRPQQRSGFGLVVVQMDNTVGSVGVDFADTADIAVGDFFQQRSYAYLRSLVMLNGAPVSQNAYASIDWGYSGAVMGDLGLTPLGMSAMYQDAMTVVLAALAAGKPVVVHTNGTTDGTLIGAHVYTIASADGGDKYLFRNPWFGNGDPGNVQEVTRAQLKANCSTVVIGNAFPVAKPANWRADVNLDGIVDIGDQVAIANAWGRAGGAADVNGDNATDMGDMVAVANAWGFGVDDVTGALTRGGL